MISHERQDHTITSPAPSPARRMLDSRSYALDDHPPPVLPRRVRESGFAHVVAESLLRVQGANARSVRPGGCQTNAEPASHAIAHEHDVAIRRSPSGRAADLTRRRHDAVNSRTAAWRQDGTAEPLYKG